jgi:small GTP-binding protein
LIKIWDTCGQERFRSLTSNYYRHADGVILVYDANEPDTFQNLKSWLNSINENTQISIPKVVIANKIDLERKISSYNLKQFSKENKVEVFESSAKTGININEPFTAIIKEVLKNKRERNRTLDEEDRFKKEEKCHC